MDKTLAAHRRYLLNESAILHDNHLSTELKLIGIIMRRSIDMGEKLPTSMAMGRMVFPGRSDQSVYHLWMREMQNDIRRYDPFLPRIMAPERCQEMLPRAKRPCGRGASGISGYLTDFETGEKHYHVWCSKHVALGARAFALERAALKERIVPRPYANTGGYLRVHLPELGWEAYWKRLDPAWEPFPEREPVQGVPLVLVPLIMEEAPDADTSRASHPAQGRRLRVLKGGSDPED